MVLDQRHKLNHKEILVLKKKKKKKGDPIKDPKRCAKCPKLSKEIDIAFGT
jgi:hypothetical protein